MFVSRLSTVRKVILGFENGSDHMARFVHDILSSKMQYIQTQIDLRCAVSRDTVDVDDRRFSVHTFIPAKPKNAEGAQRFSDRMTVITYGCFVDMQPRFLWEF